MRSRPAEPTFTLSVIAGQVEAARSPVPRRHTYPLVFVIFASSTGLLIQSLGYAAGRAGRDGLALTLFFVGLVMIFAGPAWLLLGARARRRERIGASTALVVALTVSVFLVSPLRFIGYDDLLHQASLWQWAAHRGVLAHNSLLPVSPRYPGLEALTLGIRWLTGLPIVMCEMTTVLLSRIILVLAVFLIIERLTRSSRAAGAGVIVYSASPQFYQFNAGFSYQTLALALGAGCVYSLLRTVDQQGRMVEDRRTSRPWLWLSIACCLATVVTHHLIGWMTVGLVAVWFFALELAPRRRAEAHTVGAVAGVGLLGASAWTFLNAPLIDRYLRPILGTALSGLVGLFEDHRRTLFQGTGTFVTPRWEDAVMLVSALVITALIAVSARAVQTRRTSLGGGPLRWIPVLIAFGYAIVLLSRLAASSAELGGRLSTFVFFGIAIIVGAWYAGAGRRVWLPVVVGVASVCFVGGLILGSGPDYLLIPGPYAGPSADQRSIDGASMAAARWAAANLPADSVVAADRDNAALMAAVGHLTPESEASGGVNVGPLYFAPTWGPGQLATVRHAQIRYLVVDQRLASGPPAFGTYFEPGETRGPERLTPAELGKFATVPGMQRVYDNGPIQIYDLAGLLHLPAAEGLVRGQHSQPIDGPSWPLLAGAFAVLLIWVRRWRNLSADDVLVRLLATALTVMGCAVAVFYSTLPSSWLGAAFLCIFAAIGLWAKTGPAPYRPRHAGVQVTNGRDGTGRRPRLSALRAVVLAAAAAVAAGSAVTIAIASERTAWQPPTSLAVHGSGSQNSIVHVRLAGDSAPAQLVLSADGAVISTWQIPARQSSWSVDVPAGSPRGASGGVPETLSLEQHGRVVRAVTLSVR